MTLFSLVLTLTSLAAPAMVGDVTYAEYYVSKAEGSDATGTGSIDFPWASITYALTQIPAGPTSPATLHVALGKYIETPSLPPFVDIRGRTESPDCVPFEEDSCTMIAGVNVSASNVIANVVFRGITSPGLVCRGTARPYVFRCHFNTPHPQGQTMGAGLQALDSSNPTCVECYFTSNSVRLFVAAGKGGALWQNSTGETTLVGCTLHSNSAELGGAIYAERGSVVCRDCTFTDNSASWGASIHAREAASATLINCRFTDNVLFDLWNVVRIYDLYIDGTCTIVNCTLAETKGSSDTASIGGATILNSILRGGRISIGGVVSYSNVQGYTGGVGNMNVDPRFVNPAEEDYRLRPASPCIDRATSGDAPDHDLDGNPRPVDIPARGFDGPGQGYDMGCYEYFPSPTPTPTHTPGPTPTATPVPGDITGDGQANAEDLFFFAQWWEQPRNETNYSADVNGDTHIDRIDLLRLAEMWK